VVVIFSLLFSNNKPTINGGNMRRFIVCSFLLAVALFVSLGTACAQKQSWILGMRMGLGISSGGPEAKNYNFFTGQFETVGGTAAGFQFGPTGEFIFERDFSITTALNINTTTGTPIEWQNTFKYYFAIPGSKIRPYADAGFGLIFATGGPYFDIPFGGGAMFPVAKNLYIPADLLFGPIFVTGSTQFGIAITSGIRYEFR
jgi:hypothetical protein